jgi:hypothetical protein
VSMNTTGTSGTHDTDRFGISNSSGETATGNVQQVGKMDTTGGTQAPQPPRSTSPGIGSTAHQPGEKNAAPEGDRDTVVIEVLTQESGAPGRENRLSDYPYFAGDEKPSGFRWWYIPAIVAPVAAGAAVTALVLIERRRREQLKAAELAAAAAATRNWLNRLRIRQALNEANGLIQQGMQWTRQTALTAPGQTAARRDLMNQQALVWRNMVNQQALAWRNMVNQQANQLQTRALMTAQPVVDAARSRALASRASATKAWNDASDSVNGTVSHSLAFGLGALVAATLTYVGLWRQRMMNAELEASGSGNMGMREEPIL